MRVCSVCSVCCNTNFVLHGSVVWANYCFNFYLWIRYSNGLFGWWWWPCESIKWASPCTSFLAPIRNNSIVLYVCSTTRGLDTPPLAKSPKSGSEILSGWTFNRISARCRIYCYAFSHSYRSTLYGHIFVCVQIARLSPISFHWATAHRIGKKLLRPLCVYDTRPHRQPYTKRNKTNDNAMPWRTTIVFIGRLLNRSVVKTFFFLFCPTQLLTESRTISRTAQRRWWRARTPQPSPATHASIGIYTANADSLCVIDISKSVYVVCVCVCGILCN